MTPIFQTSTTAMQDAAGTKETSSVLTENGGLSNVVDSSNWLSNDVRRKDTARGTKFRVFGSVGIVLNC